jgi:flagellar biosynthesis/type III secretory pathway protein FliH
MLKEDMMRIFNEEFKSQIEHARNLAFQEAKREGMKEGKKEGMKEGKKEGMKEGKEKGSKETAKSILEMFDSGKSPEEIKAYLKTNFTK